MRIRANTSKAIKILRDGGNEEELTRKERAERKAAVEQEGETEAGRK